MWQIDLVGDQADIGELKVVAQLCDCVIALGLDGRHCLSGDRFASLSTPEQVRAEAVSVLKLLNFLARRRWSQFRPVQLGMAVSRNRPDGTRDVAVGVLGVSMRSRASLRMTVIRSDGRTEAVIAPDLETQRANRINRRPETPRNS
jgi:hypothetical protein